MAFVITVLFHDFCLNSAKPHFIGTTPSSRLLEQNDDFLSYPGDNQTKTDPSGLCMSANHTGQYRVRRTPPCVSDEMPAKFDSCRNKIITEVRCLQRSSDCLPSIFKWGFPKCKTVYGYKEAKYITRCNRIAIDCQCA